MNPQAVFVTISTLAESTVIYYDHWEDGYENDITNPTQPTTLIFGDGNPTNGYPPGNPGDLITAGTTFNLRNFIDATTLQSVVDYDARDKVVSFKPISLTKTIFPTATATLLAGCVEIFEQGLWGNEYRVPVGVDMPTSAAATPLTLDTDIFSYSALSIMAGSKAASVQIDADNNGTFEQTVSLSEGESVYVNNVSVGARILSTNPVQVVFFSGRPGSNYQSRDTMLLPTYRWSSSYYTPVSTVATNGTTVFLYNPGASDITVSYDYRNSASSYTTATINVPAGGNARVNLQPANGTNHFGGYRFYTTGGTPPTFYAFSAVDASDAATSNNQAYDGGSTLVGQPSLTTQVLLSLGNGRDPYSLVNPSENGNPVWITTVGNGHTPATIYVDFNGDNVGALTDPNGNKYDVSYSLRELEQQQIFDPDGDQTGMLVYSLDPSVKIAAIWAQDPTKATAGTPGFDVSTLIPPLREGESAKSSSLVMDVNGDGFMSPEDTIEVDIRCINTSRTDIPGPFRVTDNLPSDLVYVPGTAIYRYSAGEAWQDWVAIPDDGTGTAFPLDGTGYLISGTIPFGEQIQVKFQCTVKPAGQLTTERITNTGSVEISPYGLIVPIGWTDVIYGSIGDRVWNDVDGDGVQDVGETGIAGVTVYADLNNNSIRDTNETQSVTNSNGDYLIPGLVSGSYVIRVDPASLAAVNVQYGPAYDRDGVATSYVATATLQIGEGRTDVDFGFRTAASFGDRVWLDRDNDGVQESGEPGINGVRVYIDTNGNNSYDVGEPNSFTFGDGTYYIGNLATGSKEVRVDTTTLPAGLTQTYDLNGLGTAHEATVTLTTVHNPNLDFGYRGGFSIGDLVWYDTDNGGTQSATVYNVIDGRIDIINSGSVNTADDGIIGAFTIIDGFVDMNGSGTITAADTGTFQGYNVIAGALDINGVGGITTADDATGAIRLEYGIPGIRVYIDADGDGVFDANEAFAITSSLGAYSITNLPNGTYTVRVDTSTIPSSYAQTYDLASPTTDHTATVVISGANRTDVDFGYRDDASIGDYVWNDLDGDGIKDPGEPGIQGVIVYLDTTNNNVFDFGTERYAITDVNGYYLINNLASATYELRVDVGTLPIASVQTYDLDGLGTAHTANRTLTGAENATDVDFGYNSTASLGNRIWNDSDYDGIQDVGETGINNVRVFLDLNGNGSFDASTEPSSLTAGDGNYSFSGFVAGTYTVMVDSSTLAPGLVQTYDLNGVLDNRATVPLVAGQVRSDVDYGYTAPAAVGNFVWYDVNANGQQDVGEPGLNGVSVTLYRASDNGNLGTTTTAGGGFYSFTNLLPGSYYLIFGIVNGYGRTGADAGSDATDSDANIYNGRTSNFTIASGMTDNTRDAGYGPQASIGNFVWSDSNGNGVQDGGEPGVDGVTVNLYNPGFGPDGSPGNGDDSNIIATTTTSGGGSYHFGNLAAGTYVVRFAPPAGYTRTTAHAGSDDSSDSDANTTTGFTGPIAVTAGQSNATVDAGYCQTATIGDLVWSDTNANGVQDLGEPGMEGISVELLDVAGNPVLDASNNPIATFTGSSGAYSISGVIPGSYRLRFNRPSGYIFTEQNADGLGLSGMVNSDANPATGITNILTVAIGQTNNNLDAGLRYVPLAKFVSQPGVNPGDPINYTIELFAPYAGLLSNVTITDSVPAGTSFVNAGQGGSNGPTVTWDLGSNTAATNGTNTITTGKQIQHIGTSTASIDGQSISLTRPTGTTEGDLMVASLVVRRNASTNIASPAGWTEIQQNQTGTATNTDIILVTYRKFAGAPATDSGPYTFTIGTANARTAAGISSYRNVSASAPVNANNGQANASSTNVVAPSVAPAVANARLLGVFAARNGGVTWTTPSGMTARYTSAQTGNQAGNRVSMRLADQLLSAATASGTRTATINTSALNIGQSIALRSTLEPYTTTTAFSTQYGLVPGGQQVAITLTASATGNAGTVTPPANLTVNGANGATASKISGPSPASAAVNNNSAVFTYVYQINAVSLPGSVSFSGTPTDSNGTWAQGTSPSVLVTPPLSFQVTANDPATVGLISNTANLNLGGVPIPSNTTETPLKGSIGDLVWIDANANGTKDPGETGIAGVTVSLRDSQNNLIASQITGNGSTDVDSNGLIDPVGFYRFRDLNAENHTVSIAGIPAGYAVSFDEDSGIASPEGVTTIVLGVNDQHQSADFGLLPSFVAISGQVRYDMDGDGNPNDADPPAVAALVSLWTDPNSDGNPGDGVIVAQTRTGGSGNYLFSNVPTGSYVVQQSNSSGASSTYDVQGSLTDDLVAVQVTDQNVVGRDFLDTLPSLYSVSGAVYRDRDASVTINAGDTSVPGVTVSIYADLNTDGLFTNEVDIPLATALTDLRGAYGFSDLPPGRYVVVETLPGGTSAVFDVEASPSDAQVGVTVVDADVTERNFLLDAPGVYPISGFLLNDADNDQAIDRPGDIGLPGVVVQLRDGNGEFIGSGVTGSNGAYSFPDLIPGDYRVTTVNPIGLDAVTDRDGNANSATRIDVNLEGAAVTDADFLVDVELLQIAGKIFDDRDFDNQFTGPDTSRAGMRVRLFREAVADGIADPSEYVAEFVTGSDGAYEFDGLVPGDYIAKLTPAQRCFFVNERGEPSENLGSLIDGQMIVTLESTDNLDNDFLLCRGIFLGAIGDRVWLDENSNGRQDPGEAGIPNVTVQLYDSTATFLIKETVTDTEGQYLFPNLSAQTYVVRTVTSTMAPGLAVNQTHDLDGLVSLHEASVALAGDTLRRDVDFGYNWAPVDDVLSGSNTGAVGNRLWIDANGNGIQDMAEAGLGGVPVSLFHDSDNDGVINALYGSTTADADGNYIFDGLPAGIYRVIVNGGNAPSGYIQTGDPDSFGALIPDGQDDNATSVPIVLGPGDVFVNADFGYQLTAGSLDVSGTIYLDLNANGQQDIDEPPAEFVSVALLDANGVIIAKTFTDPVGAYSISGLSSGTYTVWVNDVYRQLGGRLQREDPDGTPDQRHTFMLSGQDVQDLDFGFSPSEQRPGYSLVRGSVFLDRDGDEAYDTGESLRGVRVYLYDSTGTIQLDDTETNTQGQYFFAYLDAGQYIVRVDTTFLPGVGVGLTNNVDPDGGTASDSAVSITTGDISAPLVFGYEAITPRIISGTIWEDINANGTLDGTEAGRFDNVLVAIFDVHGHELGWSYTDSNGSYSFTGLPEDDYIIEIIGISKGLYGYWSSYGTPEVAGQSQALAHPVTLSGGNETADFGLYLQPSTLGDYVWWDANADGIQDGTEAPLEGQLVELMVAWPNSGGTTRIVQSTAADGGYYFGNLLLDENFNGQGLDEPIFTISVLSQPGLASPIESGSATNGTDANDADGTPASVLQGAMDDTYDFGFHSLYGSIAGTILRDTVGNGTGDAPHAGVTVELLDGSGNPIDADPDLAGIQPTTVTTADDGSYLFPKLLPETYRIRQSVPANHTAIHDLDGDDFTIIGSESPVVLTDAQILTGQDFTNRQDASIEGTVTLDFNADNVVNAPPDGPMENVIIELLDDEGTVIATTATDESGAYLFSGLAPGEYQVRQIVPTGCLAIADADGGDLAIIGNISPISLIPGYQTTGLDFVNAGLAVINGTIMIDRNGDREGEDPHAAVRVVLFNSADEQIASMETGGSGFYEFTKLVPGSYYVVQSVPAGFVAVDDVDNNDKTVNGDNLPLVISPGQTLANQDFVNAELGSISGTISIDQTGDLEGEIPHVMVPVSLFNASNEPIATTNTNDSGFYSFADVPPGGYYVAQTVPLGYVAVNDADGGDFTVIGNLINIGVAPGQEVTGRDFVNALTCPDDWNEWKAQRPGETAAGNPDQDNYDNFAEFAFNMPHNSGQSGPHLPQGTGWIIRPSSENPDILEGVFVRPTGAPLNTVYILQYAAALGNPTTWSELVIPSETLTISTAGNGDCTETVTIHNLQGVTGFATEGFARIKAILDDDGGNDETDHISYTEVEGWTETSMGRICQTYNVPYQREALFTGTIASVTGQQIDMVGNGVDLDNFLAPGVSYYVEVVSGDNEGDRFDVTSSYANRFMLTQAEELHCASGPYNTRTGALPASLVGDEVVLRRHWTLVDIFPATKLGSANVQTESTDVQFYIGSNPWRIFWLYANGGSPAWVESGDATLTDRAGVVVAPGQGLVVNNRAAATTLLAYGEVRTNDFIRPLNNSFNLVGGGYPVNQSSNGPGGRAMSKTNGFFGNTDFKQADSIFSWRLDTNPAGAGWENTFFLDWPAGGALRWVRVGTNFSIPRDPEVFLLRNRAVQIVSKNGILRHTNPAPWAP